MGIFKKEKQVKDKEPQKEIPEIPKPKPPEPPSVDSFYIYFGKDTHDITLRVDPNDITISNTMLRSVALSEIPELIKTLEFAQRKAREVFDKPKDSCPFCGYHK